MSMMDSIGDDPKFVYTKLKRYEPVAWQSIVSHQARATIRSRNLFDVSRKLT